jgi:hypothetical protein
MYVLPSDGVDEALDTNGRIATSGYAFNRWLLNQTGGRWLRIDTVGGLPDIGFFRLSRTDAQMRALDPYIRNYIEDDLRAAGQIRDDKLYAVYYGGSSGYSCGGGAWPPALVGNVGAMYLKGEPPGAPTCASNPLGASVESPGYLDFAMLHELMHTLGFVATCAPHHHLSGHVSDSSTDLMWSGNDFWHLPPLLDIGRDDYYQHTNSACADFSKNAFLTLADPGAPRTDLNGDGKSDLLWRNGSTGQVYRMLMNGFSRTGEALVYTEANTAWSIVADADFTGDGVSDLLWRKSSTGQVYLMPFSSSGFPSGGGFIYTEPNAAWKIAFTPDINGDGKADLVWYNTSTGMVYVMLLNGTSGITAQAVLYTEPNTAWRIAATGDFAGTGAENQLLWRNGTTGQLYLMTINAANLTQTGAMIYQEPNTAWKVIAAADFNNDGKSDILYRNDATGQVYILLMNNGSVIGGGLAHIEPNLAWKIVAQGDYNGDGKADLLWRNESTGMVYMMLMNGSTIDSQGVVYQEPNTAWKILGPSEYRIP